MSQSTSALPRRLTAPDPGWTIETDVVIVGSGIAGLSTALRYVESGARGRVVLVTKDVLSSGSTRWAQGGIAAAVDPADTPVAHMVDTVLAGAGLCDPHAVRGLVTEGPDALRWLVGVGTAFDRTPEGGLALTREGGHRASRIAHAGGDATGAEIERALIAAVRAEPRIEVIEHALTLDALLGTEDDQTVVRGVTLHVMGEGQRDGVGAVRAGAVVLATGGLGQVFAATTNPAVSTGDGLALALRAGAEVQDLEFVQFHPTVLWLGAQARGQQPLISEAVRGEGAFLVDAAGERFMAGEHELADLAPRDVVANTIARTMARTGTDHVHLDARHFGAAMWQRRFPTILASCRAHGIDPVTDLIPVAPAAHYASGGVRTGPDGRTSLRGLYAVGEVACTGVHGANRLASNSLLEAVVYGHRIADALAASDAAAPARPASVGASAERPAGLAHPAAVPELRAAMSRHVGVLRDAAGLAAARDLLAGLTAAGPGEPGVEAWEATNLLTVARALVAAAEEREESRGAHRRADFPEPDPLFRHPILVRLRDGEVRTARSAIDRSPYAELEAELRGVGGEPRQHVALVRRALEEDLFGADPVDVTTAATIPATQTSTADVVARRPGVVAGLALAELVFWEVAEGVVATERRVRDGDRVEPGDVLMTVTGRTRDLLTAERTALNLLTHLSGIATHTRRWVDAVAGTAARIRDSRKTHPGLRTLEKYAVRCGGGVNHRTGLSDAALIKDNHVVAAGGVAEAVRLVRRAYPGLPLEVEVDRIDQIEPALKAGAEELLLDNFDVAGLREAVRLVAGRARLESSGGLTLSVAADVAATGVDYLAVGALTHSSPALDIALDLRDTT
ncbi:L-aspartate oxidase [Marinitenerispora sediminis]|uniref:L-aspartate oxidase n=1 Tax=Marinitenerispora sediminis TaxID=1931232 RepID=A0A368T5P5_9ACTN|nr:L-aspartate oxidase [Marinitenerispora sediminis]RCV55151.1 nicotinate-nucleotide diphosphorylase (carboxylating) [Marinitenerispora sediminis]RCV58944.1 nicotinate-nucleotide diphosphorylase (carboxylating) [Marinitenerispora sediminis]RCV61508.1 nicotinate-nucleotide diphosphorylase (carboxylating) [Marinitenerispora sediminis]